MHIIMLCSNYCFIVDKTNIYDILFLSYDWVSIKAVCLQTVVVIVLKHDYVRFMVGFTNYWAQLFVLFQND